ncbi:hypothetical protein EYR27_09810 [Xanthomonas oryzae]|nr:hypothetical protein EYR27_09810 [Xanthomonas oryzae]
MAFLPTISPANGALCVMNDGVGAWQTGGSSCGAQASARPANRRWWRWTGTATSGWALMPMVSSYWEM